MNTHIHNNTSAQQHTNTNHVNTGNCMHNTTTQSRTTMLVHLIL